MRIGILTGGGDVPGLNPCIKAVVNRAEDAGMTSSAFAAGGPACSTTIPTTRRAARRGSSRCRSKRPHDRPLRRDAPAHLAHEPGQGQAERRAGVPEGASSRSRARRRRPTAPPTSCGCSSISASTRWSRLAATTRSRSPCACTRKASGDRHPEDDGQRRLRHRLLHRVLHRRHPQRRVHQRPAHAGRVARAHRRRRALRPQLRRDGADLRLPRRRRPRDHLRSAVRRRAAGQADRGGQAPQPEQLRDGADLRGRVDAGRAGGRVRPGGRLWPQEARRHRPDHRRRAQARSPASTSSTSSSPT